MRLIVSDFAQIDKIDLSFGDLTVLVGAQGTGKSLALQWFKAALDGGMIVRALREAGQNHDDPLDLIDMIFGSGMKASWRPTSEVLLNGTPIKPANIAKRGGDQEKVFYTPAHRAMLISEGWAAPFLRLGNNMPVVARLFSQTLFERFSQGGSRHLFPKARVLKKAYRDLIDAAVFHGGSLGIERDSQSSYRLQLRHGEASLPFMTWTAGQREFTPLLLGVYHVLPSVQQSKVPGLDWVIIEEPEMGLHPMAISAFLVLVLEMMWRGYKVILSTHSADVLNGVWMLQRLKSLKAPPQLICKGLGVEKSQAVLNVAKHALTMDFKVHALSYKDDNRVQSTDISNLDPDSQSEVEASWGGIARFAASFVDAVAEAQS